MFDYTIQDKVGRVLNIILLAFILILIRVWYLSVIQKEEYFQQSRKPQRRLVIENVERATIRDRFNIPLALNKIQYNVAVCYADIRDIPSSIWKTDETGKKVRIAARTNYISSLSNMLSKELKMNALEIEDTIHGKASLFPHTPFVIKEDISEKEYYKLKMLERNWAGIQTMKASKRVYPQGKVGSDVIGFLGTINQREYQNIAKEIQELKNYINEREAGEAPFLPKGFTSPIEVRERLQTLLQKSYTISDHVGKMGIEGAFDEELRGSYGKKIAEIDIKGNFLRELPGSKRATSGRRLILTLSAELQEYAEALLAQNETSIHRQNFSLGAPWIKGGAVVAVIPQTGEVVALASYPRFDPNDFIPTFDPTLKKEQLSRRLKWVENETHIKEIWDGTLPLEKECYSFSKKQFYEETLPLSWEHYLEATLSLKSDIFQTFRKIPDIKTAYLIQKCIKTLLNFSGQEEMRALIGSLYTAPSYKAFKSPLLSSQKKEIQEKLKSADPLLESCKKFIDTFLSGISNNDDQMLLIDICHLIVPLEEFTDELIEDIGDVTLSYYKTLSQANVFLQNLIKKEVHEIFHHTSFNQWRETHFKEYLKEKRNEEKLKKRYARPYTEYLDSLEKKMFLEFWNTHRYLFIKTLLLGKKEEQTPLDSYLNHILSISEKMENKAALILLKEAFGKLDPERGTQYLKTMRSFSELNKPLYGKYRMLRSLGGKQTEKHLASSFYPLAGFGYGRSQAFRQSTPQGSVFKLVTAYEALQEQYKNLLENKKTLEEINPLTLVDDIKAEGLNSKEGQYLGHFLNGDPIGRKYKGGILPRSHPLIGKINLVGALEQSSNLYFAILASDYIQDPTHLAVAAKQMGLGEKSGIELPGEIVGSLPNDLSHNKTGLYSFAIGQHSLVVTPLQTAVMISTIANEGKVIKTKMVKVLAGKEEAKDETSLFCNQNHPLKEDLLLAGIQFPLFTEAKNKDERPSVYYTPIEVKRALYFPKEIRDQLLEGMQQVMIGPKGTARASVLRSIPEFPQSIKDYIDLQYQLVAKTGTAEILYKHSLDAETPPKIENHVWYAGMSFDKPRLNDEKWPEPELVVVVYLRFGRAGKDCAPIASQIAKKWREICAKHGATSYFKESESIITK